MLVYLSQLTPSQVRQRLLPSRFQRVRLYPSQRRHPLDRQPLHRLLFLSAQLQES